MSDPSPPRGDQGTASGGAAQRFRQLAEQVQSLQNLGNTDVVAAQEQRLGRFHRFVHFWVMVTQQFLRNRCPVRASALAYTTLLALVPLLAVSISVAALFLPHDPAEQKAQLVKMIDSAIVRVAPALGLSAEEKAVEKASASAPARETATKPSEGRAKIAEEIVGFVGRIRFGAIGASAMAGLLFVAISLLRTVESAFNDIWGVARGRSWFLSIVLYWAVITLGPVVLLVVKGANYFPSLDASHATLAAEVLSRLSWLLSILLMSASFGALYLWTPNTRVQWQAALVGGVTAALLWTVNGRLSALYNTKVVTYNAIYGSLGVVPLFLLGNGVQVWAKNLRFKG